LDIHPLNDNYILTGGRDSRAILFDRVEGRKVFSFEPFDQKKKPAVTVAKFVPGQSDLYAFLGGSDGQASVWVLDAKNDVHEPRYHLKGHTQAISGASFQPLNEYVVVGSRDKSWSLHNLFQGVRLQTVQEEDEVTAIEFHPDGLIMALGLKNGLLKLYDIRTQKPFKTNDLHKDQGEVSHIAFSNKGLLMAATWKTAAKLLHLKRFDEQGEDVVAGAQTKCVSFDYFGGYLLAGQGNGLGIFSAKQPSVPVQHLEAHEIVVNVAKFSSSGSLIVSGGEDRFLKLFTL